MDNQTNHHTLSELLSHSFDRTYKQTEWFVSFNQAVAGITAEQAKQVLTREGDNIFGIVAHLTYWNERYLKKMRGQPQGTPMISANELTFQSPLESWNDLLQRAENVFSEWSRHLQIIRSRDEEHFSAIANTCMHNAYHIGQIVLLRKLQGTWDKDQGVK